MHSGSSRESRKGQLKNELDGPGDSNSLYLCPGCLVAPKRSEGYFVLMVRVYADTSVCLRQGKIL